MSVHREHLKYGLKPEICPDCRIATSKVKALNAAIDRIKELGDEINRINVDASTSYGKLEKRVAELEAKYEGHWHMVDGKRIGPYEINTSRPGLNPKENE